MIQIVNKICYVDYTNPNVYRCWPPIIGLTLLEVSNTDIYDIGKTVEGNFQQK